MKNHLPHQWRTRLGFTLVEFLVALVIGMLVVLAAIASLLGTRTTSMTNDDVNVLQQTSAQVFRILGQQIRQAGYLPIDPTGPLFYYDVNVTTPTNLASEPAFFSVKGTEGGTTAQDTLKIGYAPNGDYSADCVGQAQTVAQANFSRIITSEFTVTNGVMRCLGSGNATPQPIADGVERFDVTYGIAQTPSSDQVSRYAKAPLSDFNVVRTVRVCLQLVGISANNPTGGTYVDCDGTSQTSSDGKLRRVYTSVFALRNNLGAL